MMGSGCPPFKMTPVRVNIISKATQKVCLHEDGGSSLGPQGRKKRLSSSSMGNSSWKMPHFLLKIKKVEVNCGVDFLKPIEEENSFGVKSGLPERKTRFQKIKFINYLFL